MRKQSKKFKSCISDIDLDKSYSPQEAFELVKKCSYEEFDASVEVHVRTGIDPRKSDQTIRGSIMLPNGIGKTKRVVVFAEGEKAAEALKNGAARVGGVELIQEIKQSQKIDFDVAVATPDMMKHLAQVAKILGPKGLMPSPKNETVTTNITKTLEEITRGKINFKNDDTGNVHQVIGRRSFDADKLAENYQAFIDSLRKAKPSTAKGTFIVAVSVSSTMGPGIHINPAA
ncbi:MAG: 50S ribosomal protein L1 [Patescibacteria group bacterium]